MVPQQQREQIKKSQQWHWSCFPLWAVETLWSHSSRHLPLLPFCPAVSVSFCVSFLGKRPQWQSGRIKSVMTRVVLRESVFVWVREMGREWEWEIPFRPEGLAGSAVCVREIIFSVYSSVVSPLSLILVLLLSLRLTLFLNKFFPLAVLIFEGLIIYFHRSIWLYCPIVFPLSQ